MRGRSGDRLMLSWGTRFALAQCCPTLHRKGNSIENYSASDTKAGMPHPHLSAAA